MGGRFLLCKNNSTKNLLNVLMWYLLFINQQECIMKLAKVLVVAVVAMATLSNPAYANTAKYQKIDRVFNKCSKNARYAAIANDCIDSAVNSYVKTFNKNQKDRFQKAKSQCIVRYEKQYQESYEGFTGIKREAFLFCQYDAVKAIAKRK